MLRSAKSTGERTGIWGHFISILAPMCLSISLLSDINNRKWEMIQTHAGKDDDPQEQDDEDAGHRRYEI